MARFSLKQYFLILVLVTISAVKAAELKWWQTASFYQIYPRSFKDSDGDGVGDLKGITQQLAYLKEIGITATWLSPIFTSPMADFGYDVANFTEIDPIFGTMADFDALIAKAKLLNIKIILDFVPNHSSDECEWFVRSVANDKEYRDFYVWHPGKMVNGERQPPTNWISVFRGSMWTWNEQRQAYYMHQFHAKQPDLNYRNPKVMERMKVNENMLMAVGYEKNDRLYYQTRIKTDMKLLITWLNEKIYNKLRSRVGNNQLVYTLAKVSLYSLW